MLRAVQPRLDVMVFDVRSLLDDSEGLEPLLSREDSDCILSEGMRSRVGGFANESCVSINRDDDGCGSNHYSPCFPPYILRQPTLASAARCRA